MDWKGNGLKRKCYSISPSTNPVSLVTKEGTVKEVKGCNIILVEPLHHKGFKPPRHDLKRFCGQSGCNYSFFGKNSSSRKIQKIPENSRVQENWTEMKTRID